MHAARHLVFEHQMLHLFLMLLKNLRFQNFKTLPMIRNARSGRQTKKNAYPLQNVEGTFQIENNARSAARLPALSD
jgi:hypothetical protein